MLKQKTPLKRKTPLRRKPLRTKGIRRDGTSRLTFSKRAAKKWCWGNTQKAKEYLAAEHKTKTLAAEQYFKNGWNGCCVICGRQGMINWHHWIWKRSDAPSYRNIIVNVAPICPFCHKAAHCSSVSFELYRRKIYVAVVDKYAAREDILAIYNKNMKVQK